MFKKIFLLTAIALICSSCESPTTITSRGLDSENEKEKAIMQGIALETYYNRVEKLNNIAWPILSSSLDFCKENITDTIGIEVISLNEIDKNYRNAASEKIGLTNEPPWAEIFTEMFFNRARQTKPPANICLYRLFVEISLKTKNRKTIGDFLKNLKLTDPLAMEVLIWPYSRLLNRIGWLLSNMYRLTKDRSVKLRTGPF